ncbi:GPP34 family phosphoprotein [Sphaerisporangium album]|uniref:GPP34 family phosphoprotein n=1 Tax=Sphaerisporangium album TaxID=509200 RepID=A0A367F624_9ACTN|nr:GPP34 family phosphoprotein [Sphaerisporangium album]RCG25399.1 GPP34 family phosphoprotein [Sphaerisporangium album]
MTGVALPDLRLADDLFFAMHYDITGRTRLHAPLTGIGLAAALLGELMLADRITMRAAPGGTRLEPVQEPSSEESEGAGTSGRDPLARVVLAHIVAEPSHTVRTWLRFLARTARADVASRMTADGLLRPHRGLLGSRHLPVDTNQAAWPVGRLNIAVRRREPLGARDRVLLGLLNATGVARLVLWERNTTYLAGAVEGLAPRLQELLAQTEAAVGDAVISRR